jgi:hypothetical protein
LPEAGEIVGRQRARSIEVDHFGGAGRRQGVDGESHRKNPRVNILKQGFKNPLREVWRAGLSRSTHVSTRLKPE